MAWSAEILMGSMDDLEGASWFHVKTQGDTEADALQGAKEVYRLLTDGKASCPNGPKGFVSNEF